MTTVRFVPAARAELLDAVDWYEAHAPGRGEQFVAEVEHVLGRLSGNPLQFPAVHWDVRRARDVLACFHGNRNPPRWHERT